MNDRWLSPEEAASRTGRPLAELRRLLPHFRSSPRGRLIRFQERYVNALAEGRFSMTLYRVERDFEKLHKRAGRVYFVEAVGVERVKIGFTSGPVEERRRRLQMSAPFQLRTLAELEGSLGIERLLHRDLAHLRILPTAEWFHLRGEVADLVEHVRSKGRWP